jgi:hypothetical protein
LHREIGRLLAFAVFVSLTPLYVSAEMYCAEMYCNGLLVLLSLARHAVCLSAHKCESFVHDPTAESAVKEHHVLLDGLAADVQAIGGKVRVGVANRQAAQNR